VRSELWQRRWSWAAGLGAALLWTVLAVRWFDPGAPWRPAWLQTVPPLALAIPTVGLAALWVALNVPALRGARLAGPRGGLWLVLGLAFFFRLPLVWQGAVGYLSSDGALSGIVSIHLREGIDHLVFVPNVPYSGSLKSHLAAGLSLGMDTSRSFAMASLLFYLAFVAGLYRLALLFEDEPRWTALAAGLYAAFAPAFVTRYSLSNDGNYVEVLALGTWALWLAVRWAREPERDRLLALVGGLLLGLALWCHLLAIIHMAAFGLALLLADPRRTLRSTPPAAAGGTLGYLPGLLWNAQNGWESIQYLLPGGRKVGALEQGPDLASRALDMAGEQLPVLLGYDFGYGRTVDIAIWVLAWIAVVAVVVAVARSLPVALRQPKPPLRVLLLFTASNLLIALFALPEVPGNPRYLLFLMAPLPILLAWSLVRVRLLMALLVVFGALGSLGQAPAAFRSDARWRHFAASLQAEGVRFCYTDFFLASKLNFLSEERIVCSAKLGPTTTEYFDEYRARVEAAPEAALIAVNPTAADKLERRLSRLGVGYERKDLMKPVLLRLTRKVEPEELAVLSWGVLPSHPPDPPAAARE
jgi:hypothetical protein